MTGILEGLRVIDMGLWVAGPAAGVMLADWGAEVILVEPLSGEQGRGIGRASRVSSVIKFDGGEVNWRAQLLNRNKKGLALDLKKASGRDIFYKLIEKVDVFISNYQVSALNKLNLDYTTLSQLNPRLVYGVITAYGTKGPDKDERGYDYSAAWARSGFQYLIGEPGSTPPTPRGGMMDRASGTNMVAGILAALLHREKTGKGQELDVSLYHTGVWILASDIHSALVGMPSPKSDRTRAPNPIWNTYRTKDDRWVFLAMLQPDVYWPYVCRAIERPELENDPRFNTTQTREEHCQELISILDEILVSKNLGEWERCFRQNNCIYGRVQSPVEVTNDPQAIANNFFATIDHPAVGAMKVVATPVNFHQNPASVRTPTPEIGQHTEEILLDLGYSWDDIARLKEQGVIL
ncbi:MAG: CoA transferase [Dehalococcoidia bacterium]|nr:CoA transferase [Dehalococcoidia bacterium]